jgi:hypothetical protein
LKSAKLDDLIDVQKGLAKRITYLQAKRIFVEAVTGDADHADNQDSAEKIRERFQRENPDKFKEKAKEYSMIQAEVTTYTDKGVGSGSGSGSPKDSKR